MLSNKNDTRPIDNFVIKSNAPGFNLLTTYVSSSSLSLTVYFVNKSVRLMYPFGITFFISSCGTNKFNKSTTSDAAPVTGVALIKIHLGACSPSVSSTY